MTIPRTNQTEPLYPTPAAPTVGEPCAARAAGTAPDTSARAVPASTTASVGAQNEGGEDE